MAQTAAEMIDEVQALCGRTGDTALITDAQVTTWLNEAQKDIADRIVGLHALTFANSTSLDTTATTRYALSDITAGDYTTQPVAHVFDVFFMDGLNSTKLAWVHADEYDAQWIDPTHADSPTYKPEHWTRRGNNLEIRPLCSTSYYNYGLKVTGCFYPRDFTAASTNASDLSEADEGLKNYALSKAWRSIGSGNGAADAILKAKDYSQAYEGWVESYESRNNRLDEWDGNLYSDGIE